MDVPMVTQAKDGCCGDGRTPVELNEEETGIWMVKLAGFGFLGAF